MIPRRRNRIMDNIKPGYSGYNMKRGINWYGKYKNRRSNEGINTDAVIPVPLYIGKEVSRSNRFLCVERLWFWYTERIGRYRLYPTGKSSLPFQIGIYYGKRYGTGKRAFIQVWYKRLETGVRKWRIFLNALALTGCGIVNMKGGRQRTELCTSRPLRQHNRVSKIRCQSIKGSCWMRST